MSTLRPYQRECVDAIEHDLRSGFNRVGVMLPTGTGKTHVMAHLGVQYWRWGVLYIVHRDTLVEQTTKKLVKALPRNVSIGVVKGKRNEWQLDVVVASIHTLRSPERRKFLTQRKFLMCVVDEAHVSVSPTYMDVFETMGAFRPDGPKLVGFSATWMRSDRRGLADVWQTTSYERDIAWAIDNGFLVKPQGFQLGYDEADGLIVDVSKIKTTAGDYNEADAARAVMVDDLQHSVIRGYREHAAGRWGVLFAPTIEASEFFADALRANGIPAEGIYSNVAAGKRRATFERYRLGHTKILTTCVALAEGWDAPWCSVVLLVRPTRHVGLYIQQVGRALRPHPESGKRDALVLDFVGATDDKTLAAAIDLNLSKPPPDEDDDPDNVADEDSERESDEYVPMYRKIRGVTPIDFFGDVSATMLTTDRGVPFVIAGDRMLFVFEQPGGTWAVGRCHPKNFRQGAVAASGLDLPTAIRRASAEAVGTAGGLVRKTAAWRKSGDPPTARQLAVARAAGLDATGLTRAELSDRLDIRQASRTLRDVWVDTTNSVA